jgi:S1-C subfamily serine protease
MTNKPSSRTRIALGLLGLAIALGLSEFALDAEAQKTPPNQKLKVKPAAVAQSLSDLGILALDNPSSPTDNTKMQGALVISVDPNRDGAKSGVKRGDVIVKVRGNPVRGTADADQQVRNATDSMEPSIRLDWQRPDFNTGTFSPGSGTVPLTYSSLQPKQKLKAKK